MNRKEVIEWIKRIRSGTYEVDKHLVDISEEGIFEELWNNNTFNYGVEIGMLITLMFAFDIEKEELHDKEDFKR